LIRFTTAARESPQALARRTFFSDGAIVLGGGDKEGERNFYKELIRIADRRFAAHMASLKREK
jgi:hypothetical protein